MPLSGEIIAVNESLKNTPVWLNESPYEKGWLVKIKARDIREWEALMSPTAYAKYIGFFFNKQFREMCKRVFSPPPKKEQI